MKRDETEEVKGGESGTFIEGIDYYNEAGFMILTKRFLLLRGYCCNNGCRHCPYTEESPENSEQKCL